MSIIIDRKKLFIGILAVFGLLLLGAGFLLENSHQASKGQVGKTRIMGPNQVVIQQDSNNDSGIKTDDAVVKANVNTIAEQDQDFFMEYRMARESNRSQQIEMLKEIVNNSSASSQAKDQAQMRLLRLNYDMEQEFEIENLLKANGYSDVLVMQQPKAVTVVVKSQSLSKKDKETIKNMVSETTSAEAASVMVIAKER